MSFRSNVNPMLRSQFAETIFNQKYAHEGCMTWGDLSRTLVHDVCGNHLTKDEKTQLTNYITDMKFIPGGRYLYYAGRPAKFFNNCGVASTRVLTDHGWVEMGAEVGKTHNVMSPVDGRFYPATFHAHGTQPVREITFVPVRGKSKQRYSVRFTKNHKWRLADGSTTEDLRVGDVVPANTFAAGSDELAFLHGFIFGDGNRNGQLRLCADKDMAYLERLSKLCSVTYPESADGDPVLYCNADIEWKELPPVSAAPAYIASFIEGWIAADGHEAECNLLASVDREALEWFRDHAAYAGIVVSGVLRNQVRDVRIGKYHYTDHVIYMQNFSRGEKWAGFKVESIQDAGEAEVFCPFEPVHNQIVIDHGIHTYQCYLLKACEDSREDWANLSWKSESCLMTGGGIGTDYSVYRPSGATLTRTGGQASGPIPAILMTNEIGRHVMQGGSRRSAIYASLACWHDDVHKFIKAKDWHNMPAGTSGLTLWDLKQQDFNFPAPLDMTNISVNYNTEWLTDFWHGGDPGDVFWENVKQALSTGEPGFSFNFFDKENETLRNACTEVTSDTDSDVCNLGSINLGRIDTIAELAAVVELATKFLVCGTLVAHLPYEKIGEVRAKNRRLGLGLMGIHEWLIKRGSKYVVTSELHRWLAAYRGVSDKASREFAATLSVSRPVANRAVAPTGTIGILAGTSTGIEPVFATAYKRRYLKGKAWHYQYVIDSVAQEMIELYGIDPNKIETAIDLADKYERRIEFQADVQDYVDHAISSTINLPAWGSKGNNEDMVRPFGLMLAKYAHRLRGFTCYPDGSRGGQPLTMCSYSEARTQLGKVFEEGIQAHDACSGGVCGI